MWSGILPAGPRTAPAWLTQNPATFTWRLETVRTPFCWYPTMRMQMSGSGYPVGRSMGLDCDLRALRWILVRAPFGEVDVKGGPPHQLFANSSQYPMQCCGEWTHDGNYFLFNSWNSIESGEPAPAANLWGMAQPRGIFSRKMEKPFQMTAGPLRFFADVLDPHRDVIYTTSTRKQGQLELYDAKTKRAAPYLSGISGG